MARKAFFSVAMALSACLAFAQAGDGGLIEGDSWAFLVSPPKGWVWDGLGLRHQGIEGLFYKAGTQFSPTGLHIQITPSQKKPGGPASLRDFIEADEATAAGSNPGTLVTDRAPYAPGLGYSFTQKDFDDQGGAVYRALAYYEGEDVFLVFALFCRSAQERDQERSAFLELLDSFTYLHKE